MLFDKREFKLLLTVITCIFYSMCVPLLWVLPLVAELENAIEVPKII